ncbi:MULTISPECIES: glycoside hydrolase family 15 protein [Cryobacterium]|uniref:glycoside hydrolase family 15 protein n=1 Tax=Cryobacterium TaxID=69578 RepID=UPI000CD3AB70|nr:MULTISPECIES: glycoside hydrolase family 15 protein [Cryobacterium]POH67876.1 glycosyl hydrolase family 15 [Cryobacterium zongtaii]TFC47880.1 glycoside hydrolase family 15 protein [Cryobacterium sp. TMN-39-2]
MRFPPIAEYAFLSDCEVSTLIAPNGAVEWLCLPRPDSPSVFGALLDRTAGLFNFSPTNTAVPEQRRYLPGTTVLETTWHTPTGWMTVKDVLVMGPLAEHRREGFRRSPGDSIAQRTLLRIATCFDGRVELQVNCFPLFDYARQQGVWNFDGPGYTRAKVVNGDISLVLSGSVPLGVVGGRCTGRTTLETGESAFVALSWDDTVPHDLAEANRQLEQTEKYWRNWMSMATFPDHRFRPYIERSALALKGLSYAPTGAIMAAATTSLPETPGGERNWEYRYSWIRDTAFMLRALHGLGFNGEAYDYFAFIMDAVVAGKPKGPWDLQIMYGIGGELDLSEQTLDHLSGYRGSRPVRIGNGAFNQHQHDVWGMLLDSVEEHLRGGGQIAPVVWERLADLVDTAIRRSAEPDQGIWEMRGAPQHFVASKVMCWVAADRGARIAESRGDAGRVEKWRLAAKRLKAEICERGVSERGVFTQHYDSTDLDASLLLLPIMGFLPPDDERVRATVLAIADELTENGLVLRYRVASTDDGLSGDEGTFSICSFWLVSALVMIGEHDAAEALFEKLLSFAGPMLLYAEEIDATTGQHLGNFPQAFTHLSLIDAATRLIKAERRTDEATNGLG